MHRLFTVLICCLSLSSALCILKWSMLWYCWTHTASYQQNRYSHLFPHNQLQGHKNGANCSKFTGNENTASNTSSWFNQMMMSSWNGTFVFVNSNINIIILLVHEVFEEFWAIAQQPVNQTPIQQNINYRAGVIWYWYQSVISHKTNIRWYQISFTSR